MAKKSTAVRLELAPEPAITLKSDSGQRLKLTLNDMATFQALTNNQQRFFELYKSGAECMLLHGVAGTGKTFIALYRALEEALDKGNPFQQVVVVRSAVPSREIGHLPGD